MKTYNEFRVYVGTYAKYNDGSIFGAWLDLADYADVKEFYQACLTLHKDEQDPELMFQDYENIPEFLISECSLNENIYVYIDAVSEMDDPHAEAFEIYCSQIIGGLCKSEAFNDLLEQFNDSYKGYYGGVMADAKIEFAYELIEQTGMLAGIAESIARYFDYDAFARDLFLDGYSEYDGHVFLD